MSRRFSCDAEQLLRALVTYYGVALQITVQMRRQSVAREQHRDGAHRRSQFVLAELILGLMTPSLL